MSLNIFEDFLDETLYQDCLQYSIIQYQLENFQRSNHSHWPKGIVQDSEIILVHDMPMCDLYQRIKSHIKQNLDNVPKGIMFYYWKSGSHIPWHNDQNHSGAITIYLNQEWDKNHGGIFLFKKDQIIQAVVPAKNRAVMQWGGVPHAVSCTTKNAVVRLTIQMFF
jgi:Rps23 Pro-64 3,4-dihydroxylase Tpa1-like proline 4-hydroxylase